MTEPHPKGTHIRHPTRGLGKVVYADGAIVHAYFLDREGERPEQCIGRFPPTS